MDAQTPADTHLRELLEKARRGSKEAQGALLEACRPALLRRARREVPSDLRAKLGGSDLVQDSLAEAHRDFGAFRGESGEALAAWLGRILDHNLVNFFRAFRHVQKRQVGRESPDEGPTRWTGHPPEQTVAALTPSEELQLREQAEEVQARLARLPEHYRLALELRYRGQRDFREIGQALGCSAEAARKLVTRALRHIQVTARA